MQISQTLRSQTSGGFRMLAFWCPGCEGVHSIRIEGVSPVWSWNQNAEAPTFQPSILVRTGHYVPGGFEGQCYCTWDKKDQEDFADMKCTICHSFVTDGKIQFLSDSTHLLAGQTVPLPQWSEHYGEGDGA